MQCCAFSSLSSQSSVCGTAAVTADSRALPYLTPRWRLAGPHTKDRRLTAALGLLQAQRFHAMCFMSPQQRTPLLSRHVPPLGNFCLFPAQTGFALAQVGPTSAALEAAEAPLNYSSHNLGAHPAQGRAERGARDSGEAARQPRRGPLQLPRLSVELIPRPLRGWRRRGEGTACPRLPPRPGGGSRSASAALKWRPAAGR